MKPKICISLGEKLITCSQAVYALASLNKPMSWLPNKKSGHILCKMKAVWTGSVHCNASDIVPCFFIT